jgi:hypothetical protein
MAGFHIVFGGADFHPDQFMRHSRLSCDVVIRGTVLSEGRVADESWVEISDIHPGRYPLNMVWEALDLLRSDREEFLRLSRFAGITCRKLQFFGDAYRPLFDFEAEEIALLRDLGLSLSIYVDVDSTLTSNPT